MWIILSFVVIALAFISFESWARHKTHLLNRSDPALWNILFYSSQIQKQPNQEISFRLYGPMAELLFSADFRLNNYGFISRQDYEYEREANEFRIVVIGGEQTASSVANISWPDVLEDVLTQRDPHMVYKVFNIGWPDAGPEHYLKYWEEDGSLLNPDLVIVNYVETDFYRTIKGAPLLYKGQPVRHSKIEYRVGRGSNDVAWTTSAHIGEYNANSFRDSSVGAVHPYGFFAEREFMNDPARVRELQERIVDDMIAGSLSCWGCLTFRLLQGKRPFVQVVTERSFDPPPSLPLDKQKMIQFGVTNFGKLVDKIDHLIITHNFNYFEKNTHFEFTKAMCSVESKIEVVDMRKRVAAMVEDDEFRSWYLFPHMPEKWSDLGHQAYGAMMADVVKEWRGGNLKMDSF